ncbi:MAG TPA: hypothetical protein PK760_05480, partial [Flavobacteriales bacterium]|nr:hypothetical protein [Flavobacteriales bacterium]
FVDARDVAACMVKLMQHGTIGERYLLVGESASYQQLFTAFAKAMGKPLPDRAAQPWMLNLAWRAERLRTMIFGGTPMVTKATADSSMTKRGYSNSKVQALLAHPFRSLTESVTNVSSFVMGAP